MGLERINNCPRCGGDLLNFAEGKQCLQCSYEVNPFPMFPKRPAHDTSARTWQYPGKDKNTPAKYSTSKIIKVIYDERD